MTFRRISFADAPERITEESFDGIWVFLADRHEPSPLRSPALEWLDWKLQGQISRVLLTPADQRASTTVFVPTMHKVASPYLAVEWSQRWDASAFAKNCRGLGLKHVLCFCEQPGDLESLEAKLGGLSRDELPSQLSTGTDAAVGARE